MSAANTCPCGSGRPYGECCESMHKAERFALTAEALMRSRYAAFVLQLGEYLARTWHVSTRPASLELEQQPDWLGLQILATEKGSADDSEGRVEFAAFYQGGQLHERSRFVKENGQWFYLDGKILPPVVAAKVGRNEPCSCGSGKKYKKCCGAG